MTYITTDRPEIVSCAVSGRPECDYQGLFVDMDKTDLSHLPRVANVQIHEPEQAEDHPAAHAYPHVRVGRLELGDELEVERVDARRSEPGWYEGCDAEHRDD